KDFDPGKLLRLLAALAAAYAALKWFLFILLPLGLGWILSHFLQRPIEFLNKKLKIKKSFCSAALVFLSLVLIALAIGFAIYKLSVEANGVLLTVGDALRGAGELAENAARSIDGIIGSDLEARAPQIIGDLVSRVAQSLPELIGSVVSSIPFVLIGTVIFIMSSFSFCSDFHRMNKVILSFFDPKSSHLLSELKDQFLISAANYVKAYMCLFVISFTQLYFGLTVLGAKFAFSAAFFIAVCDVLPLLGMGVVVIPWMALSFFSGNAAFGAGLAIMFAVMTFTRQIAEPKVVGSFIGLHPLASLICVCVGLRILGVIGVFVFPVLVTILLNLKRTGRLEMNKANRPKPVLEPEAGEI
ncbi:MAG: AI-2E family transporter, partial [Clostridia bacterium]|nr:AI-2E family transporter [Clostridia bacterium]